MHVNLVRYLTWWYIEEITDSIEWCSLFFGSVRYSRQIWKNNRCYKPHTNGTIPPQFGLRLPKKCFPSINCIPISGMQPNREKNIFCNREVKNQKEKHYNNNNILLWKINRREIIVTMNWAIQLCVAFFFLFSRKMTWSG